MPDDPSSFQVLKRRNNGMKDPREVAISETRPLGFPQQKSYIVLSEKMTYKL